MKKKLFSIIMCALMVMCLMPSMAFADSNSCSAVIKDANGTEKTIEAVSVTTEAELRSAVEENGKNVVLANDITMSGPLTIKQTLAIVGNGHKLAVTNYQTSNARAINVWDGSNITVTFSNLTIEGPTSGSMCRGISTGDTTNLTLVIDNCNISTLYYALNIVNDGNPNIIVRNSTLDGYCAFQTFTDNTKATFENCTLNGNNQWSGSSDDFATIVVNEDADNCAFTFDNCKRVAATEGGTANEYLFSLRNSSANISITGNNEFDGKFLDPSSVSSAIEITGGTYDEDVTKYCAEGYIATKNADGKYVVGLIPDEVVDADLDTDIEQGEPDVKVDVNITDKESAKTVAESVSADLKDTKAAENITVTDADKKNAVQKLVADKQIKLDEDGNIVPYTGSGTVTVTIIEEPYLEVEVTELKTDSTTGKKELALDITPKYNLKATTNPDDASKTVTVSTGNTLTVNEKTKVTIELPTGFANSGDKLLVTHTKRNGSIEYLTGSVTAENSKLNLSFTTSSFSLFAVSNEYAASIGEGDDMQVYGTLQSAVDAVKNGETIKLYEDGQKAVVKRTVSFTVDPSYTDKESGATKNYNYTITLGDNCTRKDTGNENEWNITYTAPVSKKSPNTGDNNELGIFAVAGLISAVGVALVLRRKHSM